MSTPPPLTELPKLPPPALSLPPVRRNRWSGWLSFVLHLVLLLLLVEITKGGLWWEPPELLGTEMDRTGGGGGTSQDVQMVTLAPLPPAARVVQPKPSVATPQVQAPVVVPKVIPPVDTTPPADTVSRAAPGGATGGSGGGSGGGNGPGTGPGTGPGSGPGPGGPGPVKDSTRTAGSPPEPRQLILPPFDYPKTMKGRTIQVTFFVLADGRVDHVVFGEDIPDRGYSKKLEERLLAYRFRPARSAEGQPVPGHTIVSISF